MLKLNQKHYNGYQSLKIAQAQHSLYQKGQRQRERGCYTKHVGTHKRKNSNNPKKQDVCTNITQRDKKNGCLTKLVLRVHQINKSS